MRLEPVAEGAAKHARGSARRAALHDEVLAVKEIRRVAGIKWHGGKAVEWTEDGACPFPPVADEVVHTEGACARGMRTDGNGIPIGEIEVAMFR